MGSLMKPESLLSRRLSKGEWVLRRAALSSCRLRVSVGSGMIQGYRKSAVLMTHLMISRDLS